MADVQVATNPNELLGSGRRHLAVKDYSAAAETLATACELLAKEHGDTADQCAEPYLWYGKALLGLSREESGVLGDGVPGAGNHEDDEDDDDDQEENGEGDQAEGQDGEAKENEAEEPKETAAETNEQTSKVEKPSINTKVAGSSHGAEANQEPGTSNGEANDESVANLENDDDVDNLQLAWEMLDLSRSILVRRIQDGGGEAARVLLADVHLALGEVALESETYDKAVVDLQSCLELQKELFRSDDRRIAETHYQMGLANSLASNFEEAITHFKNAANILETRIKTLENPTTAAEDVTVKKYTTTDPLYSIEAEVKELRELLPEIQEKIQDMMDYKAETIKRVRETLSNGGSPFPFSSNGAGSSTSNGNSSSASTAKPVTNISHLVKRKRKASEDEAEGTTAKRANT